KTLAIPPPSSAEDAFAHASARGDEQYQCSGSPQVVGKDLIARRWKRFPPTRRLHHSDGPAGRVMWWPEVRKRLVPARADVRRMVGRGQSIGGLTIRSRQRLRGSH